MYIINQKDSIYFYFNNYLFLITVQISAFPTYWLLLTKVQDSKNYLPQCLPNNLLDKSYYDIIFTVDVI